MQDIEKEKSMLMQNENTYAFKKRKTYFLLWRRIYRFERQYDVKHNGALNDERLQTVLPNRQKKVLEINRKQYENVRDGKQSTLSVGGII